MTLKSLLPVRRSPSRQTARLSGRLLAVGVLAAVATLSACDSANVDSRPMQKNNDGTWSRDGDNGRDTIFGKGGLDLFGNKRTDDGAGGTGGGSGIGVNAYLWRAALDTASFMPLSSADPFGGVIITDWYQPANSPMERFKVTMYIMGRALRADALKVSAFRQVRDQNTGGWLDAPTDATVNTQFENAVLTRARQLRMAAPADSK